MSFSKLFVAALVVLVAALGFVGCEKESPMSSDLRALDANAISVVNANNSGSSSVTLYAGQTTNAGSVSFDDVDTDNDGVVDALQVCYTTTDGWELAETHLWVGTSLAGMPTTKNGNPIPGQFPYSSGAVSGTSYCVTIPFTAFGYVCGNSNPVYVAAHAVVNKNGVSETGWGSGTRFVTKGNWGTYSTIVITCDENEEPPTETCETAFAMSSGDDATCFSEFGFSRWGWSNGPVGVGEHTYDLYAGAGQCDISKGTWVGTLTVDYNGSIATVTYSMFGGFTLDETHLYVGSEPLPRKNGEYTVAPGQYPNTTDLNKATSHTYTVSGLSGNIYVVAHAVVCGSYPIAAQN